MLLVVCVWLGGCLCGVCLDLIVAGSGFDAAAGVLEFGSVWFWGGFGMVVWVYGIWMWLCLIVGCRVFICCSLDYVFTVAAMRVVN